MRILVCEFVFSFDFFLRDFNLAFRLEESALALRTHFRSLGEINSVRLARAMHIVLLIL